VCKDLRDRLSGEMHAWRSHRMILAVGFQPTDRDASRNHFQMKREVRQDRQFITPWYRGLLIGRIDDILRRF